MCPVRASCSQQDPAFMLTSTPRRQLWNVISANIRGSPEAPSLKIGSVLHLKPRAMQPSFNGESASRNRCWADAVLVGAQRSLTVAVSFFKFITFTTAVVLSMLPILPITNPQSAIIMWIRLRSHFMRQPSTVTMHRQRPSVHRL